MLARVGRVLRKMSIDELPQMWNVLRGEMSIVGPRPALSSEMAGWTEELASRLRVKPGVTGMWQVSGRSTSSFDDYIRPDLAELNLGREVPDQRHHVHVRLRRRSPGS